MKRLLGFLRGHGRDSAIAPLFKLLEATLDLLIPLIMADIINVGIAAGDRNYVLQRCLWMVGLGLCGLVFSITAQYFAARASVRACARARRELFVAAQELDAQQADLIGASTLLTRMTSDIGQVQSGLNLFLRLFLRSPFVVAGAAIMAFTVSVRGALVFAVALPLLALAAFGIMYKTLPGYGKTRALLDKLTGKTRESLTGARVTRAFGREEGEVSAFAAANESLTRAQLKVGGVSALLNPLTYAVVNLAVAAILSAGAVQVNIGALRTGDVVALVNYMSQILVEMVKLANLVIQLTRACACAERIDEMSKLTPVMRFGDALAMAEGEEAVSFSRVSLRYPGAGGESLTDVSFSVKKGWTVGVIGGTGSGKSSLVNLIPRFYDATEGQVRVFGRDVRDYTKESLRKLIAVVPQKARLFSGTIRGNLLFGGESADDDALWRALETAQAAEVVRGKANGLSERVEQGGRNFSGGQRQRLTVARALVSNPDILILDDSASALDFATDAKLRAAIAKLPGEMTVFVVSQRAGSVKNADLILVLDQGALVGAGAHGELMRSCPVYREIFESQFKGAQEGEIHEDA